MSEPKTWVLAWRPFEPTGMFIHKIGNPLKNHSDVAASYGLKKALRMTRGEAEFMLQSIKEEKSMPFSEDLVIVNLTDHEIVL